MKALRGADRSLEVGDMQAIPHFLNVVAELDRYHGLGEPARRAPLARRADKRRLATPPLRLAQAPGGARACRRRGCAQKRSQAPEKARALTARVSIASVGARRKCR